MTSAIYAAIAAATVNMHAAGELPAGYWWLLGGSVIAAACLVWYAINRMVST